MLSPVWTPIGSIFSIEQMMMALSARSRKTSISYSFPPSTHSPISTSGVGDASSPPARPPEGEARANERRKADMLERLQRLVEAVRDRRARTLEPDPIHRLAEF